MEEEEEGAIQRQQSKCVSGQWLDGDNVWHDNETSPAPEPKPEAMPVEMDDDKWAANDDEWDADWPMEEANNDEAAAKVAEANDWGWQEEEEWTGEWEEDGWEDADPTWPKAAVKDVTNEYPNAADKARLTVFWHKYVVPKEPMGSIILFPIARTLNFLQETRKLLYRAPQESTELENAQATATADTTPETKPQPIEDLPTTMKDHCFSKFGPV